MIRTALAVYGLEAMPRFLLRFLRLACLILQGGVMTNNALTYPKAVEMGDRGSARRGSIRGCDCLPSRAIGNTTSRDSIGNPILDISTVSRFPPVAFQTRNTRAASHPDQFRADRRAVLKYRTSSATAFAR